MLEALLSNPDSTTVLLSVGVWPSQYTLGFFLTVVKRVGAGYGFLPVLQLLQSLSAHYFMHRWVRLLPGPLGTVLDSTIPAKVPCSWIDAEF